jgi:hypothetical protein
MANAKRCDICGRFYEVSEETADLMDPYRFLDYLLIHKAEERKAVMRFDTCKKCQQELIDYILAKRAVVEEVIE